MCLSIAVSDSKANHLYWLGRYAERAYLSLHFMRRYFDMIIDGDPVDFATYAKNLGPETAEKMSFKEFGRMYFFDLNNPCSLLSILTRANDNAIVVREVIKSESLSYIQMSICLVEKLSKLSGQMLEDEIPSLQQITDNLLAFFGSIEERLYSDKLIAFVRYGRFIESMDMHLRFDYQFDIVREVFDSLLRWSSIEKSVFNTSSLSGFNSMLTPEQYELNDYKYKSAMLNMVNSLIVI